MRSKSNLTHYAWLSIAAALTTLFLKLASYWLTGSVGLLSDALESLVNLAAAVIALISLTISARPADEEHAYGHTKVEYFSSGIEGALILVAATGIGWSAVGHLIHPHPLEKLSAGLIIATVASLINLVVARILFRAAREGHSVTLEADAHHLMTDVWTSVVVISGVGIVSLTGWFWLDPLLGLAVAVQIIITGVKLVRNSMLGLMDTGLPPEELALIRDVLDKHAGDGVQYHALRTRVAGAWRFMSVHLLVPGNWTVAHGHDIAEDIEQELRSQVPRLTVTTHLEPVEDPVSWDDVELERAPVQRG
ncbi:MAG: cation diffusion facilitator family transporter [Verrucomicrobia bacterium]|nr:cation diffusion facilitator family transporter [Verrucomicrobiota bacterium]